MLRQLIIAIARRKNPSFTLDSSVKSTVLAGFLWEKLKAWCRALKFVSSNRSVLLFCGRDLRVEGTRNAHFGKGVQLGDSLHISAWGSEGLSIGDYSWIGGHSYLKVSFSFNDPGKFIRIGRNVGIGEFAHLGGAGGLEIGDDCIIGPYFSCHPENHRFPEMDTLIRLQGTERKGIHIGKNCWIGAKVTILDGVEIGANSIIAAGAVVTKSMPDNAVIGGVPAKVIRLRNQDSKEVTLPGQMFA